MGRWQTIVEMLNRESISQAGVFSLDGTSLAASREMSLHPRSATALITSFRDRSGALFGIHVGQDLFKCYRAGEHVMIGKACGSYSDNRMFAAMLTEECLIFCMLNMASTSRGEHKGSVLGVMQAALSKSKNPAPARQLPVDCRVEVSAEDLPLIDLEIH